MNQMQRILAARRLPPSIIPPSCFLHRRWFSTSETDASSSAHQKIQTSEDRASNKSRSTQSSTTSSLDEQELAKFSAIADTWWHSEGSFKPLHLMNPTWLAFIRSTLCRHFSKDPSSARPFEGLRLIDVGCGGGLLSEPLARMGATVTGIDAVDKNVKIARLHADMDPMTSTIDYQCTTTEKLVDEGRTFDVVLALEVIEHVANLAEFCNSLSALTISNGATILSTNNRSMRAYASAIVAAEYILQWVKEMAGFVYNPITGRWLLSDDISVNFIAYGKKKNALADI
ncbi:hypothetical protein Bca101_081215 [Brassica carinata]